MFHVPEANRVTNNPLMRSSSKDGNNGVFYFAQSNKRDLYIIASDASDWESSGLTGIKWEHVSVHVHDGKRNLTPRWDEMCHVKDIFWDAEDVVIQFHPKKSEYINNHPNVLHLWRPIDFELPTPPKQTVGV